MPQAQVHIARGELRLGTLALPEVRELLNTGFLQPTDSFWTQGQREWLPLSELPAPTPGPAGSVVTKVTGAVVGAAEATRRGAVAAAAMVSSATERRKQEIATASNRMLEDFLPRLRALVANALAMTSHTVEAVLRDEVLLRKLFGAVYDVLPKAVRRFVAEEAFIGFCLKHRARLLNKPD